jgi:hypothetical protein
MSNPNRKWNVARLAKIGGRILMLVALVFVGREFVANWSKISVWHPGAAQIGLLTFLAIAYGLATFLLAENWHLVVDAFVSHPRRRTYRAFILTHILKYVPGNVTHLLGRAMLMRGEAITDLQLGQATLIDLAVPAAAAVLCLLVAALVVPLSELLPPAALAEPFVLPAAISVVLAASALPFLSWRWSRLVPRFYLAVLIGMVFMGILGAIFSAIVDMLQPTAFLPVWAAAILGWLVGYLTPGAPAGLGTREAFLLLALSQNMPSADSLIAVGLFRLVTIVGDVIGYAIGLAFLGKQRSQESTRNTTQN